MITSIAKSYTSWN